jgi:hypothetical protein
MYRGFNLDLSLEDLPGDALECGQRLYSEKKINVESSLNKYCKANGALDADMMKAEWFQDYKANVFISHSHKNEDTAIALAGYLSKLSNNVKLISFIDSCVWGYANKLLKAIDKDCCILKEDGHNVTYNYDKRNISTGHVHMMLSTALIKMIDNTECLFFLNTPESITPSAEINSVSDGITDSAWIYSEIVTSQLIRKRKPSEHREEEMIKEGKREIVAEAKMFSIEYNVQLGHLVDLNWDDLNQWYLKEQNYHHPLDALYDMKPIVEVIND